MKTYKIIHPAYVQDWVDINAPGKSVRRADARDVDAPHMDDHDRRNGCIILVYDQAA